MQPCGLERLLVSSSPREAVGTEGPKPQREVLRPAACPCWKWAGSASLISLVQVLLLVALLAGVGHVPVWLHQAPSPCLSFPLAL